MSRRSSGLMVLAVSLSVSPAWAQWESGSDGSDGAFSPAVSTVVDLSLAASLCDCDGDTQIDDVCRWDCPSPVAGRGVYDAEQWAVVFKYSTVNVAAGATITFGHHPSGAPVVWLASGIVTIDGRVNVDGEDAPDSVNPTVVPYYTRPGPGGFQGGQSGHPGASSASSYGLGPGSSPQLTGGCNGDGNGASYATVPGGSCGGTQATGLTYGNSGIMPMLGGSGGNQAASPSAGCGGGAGGGVILVAAPTQVTVGSVGSITAEGGNGGSCAPGGTSGGSGSGGAIRLRAETVSLSSGSKLVGRGGVQPGAEVGGNGRVRIEASSFTNLGTINGSQSFPGAPSPVFAATPPQLYVTSVCGQSAPLDPEWGIYTADIDLNSASACTVNISGTGMPVGTIVVVRAIPARGSIISVNSTPMVDAGGGLRTSTASVTFPGGRSELQLRANW